MKSKMIINNLNMCYICISYAVIKDNLIQNTQYENEKTRLNQKMRIKRHS
jgi:hypothetical protein